MLCSGSHGRSVFNDVHSQIAGSLLNCICQVDPSLLCVPVKIYVPKSGNMHP